MIDESREQLHLLVAIAEKIPGRPHITTLYRWYKHGLKGVKLETVLVGGRRYTSAEAVKRFVARLNGNKK